MKFKSSLLILSSAVITSISARQITVSPSGGDYTTIRTATSNADPGDTVMVSASTYDETVQVSVSGRQDALIVIKNRGSDSVTVTGGFVLNGSYCLIDGFTISEGTVQFNSGARNNIVSHCMLHTVEGSAVQFESGSSRNTVRYSTIYRPGNKGMEMSGSYNVFEYSTIEGPAGQTGNYDSDAIRNYGGDHNVIRGNRIYHIYNVGESHGDAFQLWTTFHHLTLEDNIIGSRDDPNSDDPGNAHMMIELTDDDADSLIIRRNIFLGADQPIDVYQNQHTRSARFRNVFVHNNIFASDQVVEFRAMINLEIINNIFNMSLSRPYRLYDACENVTADYNCFYPGGSGISEPNSIYDNPEFVDPAGDFHLQSTSPCINKGTDVGLDRDREGNPIVGLPDIGPYEYQDFGIVSRVLPDADEGIAYSTTLQADGGSTPYTWRLESGTLPTGLSLNENGIISGTPTESGEFGFTVSVTDADNATSSAAITCNVIADRPLEVSELTVTSSSSIQITFSKEIDSATALDEDNYNFGQNMDIISIQLTSVNSVSIETAELEPDTSYRLCIGNITERNRNERTINDTCLTYQISYEKSYEAETADLSGGIEIENSDQASGGAYITATSAEEGSAELTISIDKEGRYALFGRVYAPTEGRNSFYYSIDESDTIIWDIQEISTSWNWKPVSARGSGSFDAPEFDTIIVDLSEGDHIINIYGRESNTFLDAVKLIRLGHTNPVSMNNRILPASKKTNIINTRDLRNRKNQMELYNLNGRQIRGNFFNNGIVIYRMHQKQNQFKRYLFMK